MEEFFWFICCKHVLILYMNTESRMQLRKNKRSMRWRLIGIAALALVLLAVVFWRFFPKPIKEEQQLNVPIMNQMPDLPNGCEVTSLAMLLNYYGIKVTKDELASNIAHVSSYSEDGQYRGNPHQGFVGYMGQANAGWCVYNEPLYNVARKYTNRIQNATGDDFDQIINLVSDGHPVMIITTLKFNRVNDMQTWNTKQGKVNVTPSSHACVITGYNEKKKIVYVNDPYGYKNRAVSWSGIEASYNQQGKQALYVE